MYPRNFDPERVKEFFKNTIRDYTAGLLVNNFVNNTLVTEEMTDETYFQVGFRTLIDNKFFRPQKGPIHIAPMILELGRGISKGETKYLVDYILNDQDILGRSSEIDKHELSPEKLLEICGDITDGRILMPTDFFWELLKDDDWRGLADFSKRIIALTPSLTIFHVPYKLFSDKIIILDNESTEWKFVEHYNDVTGENERLKIELGDQKGDNIELTLLTLNKFEIDKNKVKVVNLAE